MAGTAQLTITNTCKTSNNAQHLNNSSTGKNQIQWHAPVGGPFVVTMPDGVFSNYTGPITVSGAGFVPVPALILKNPAPATTISNYISQNNVGCSEIIADDPPQVVVDGTTPGPKPPRKRPAKKTAAKKVAAKKSQKKPAKKKTAPKKSASKKASRARSKKRH
jgi:hypothetical protein